MAQCRADLFRTCMVGIIDFFLDIMLYKSVLKKESRVGLTDFLKIILQKF